MLASKPQIVITKTCDRETADLVAVADTAVVCSAFAVVSVAVSCGRSFPLLAPTANPTSAFARRNSAFPPKKRSRCRTRFRRVRDIYRGVSRPFRIVHRTARRILGLLTLIVTVVGLYQFYRPLVSGPPAKQPMTGKLTVAVAGFAATRATRSTDPADLREARSRPCAMA